MTGGHIYTLLRTGIVEDNFEKKLANANQDLLKAVRTSRIQSYAFLQEHSPIYFLFLSESLLKKKPYNLVLTINSRDPELNIEVANTFEYETGLHLIANLPPEKIQDVMRAGLSNVFLQLEKNPSRMRSYLQTLNQIPLYN